MWGYAHLRANGSPEEDFGFPAAGGTGVCELLDMHPGILNQVLYKSMKLSFSEPSLSPKCIFLHFNQRTSLT